MAAATAATAIAAAAIALLLHTIPRKIPNLAAVCPTWYTCISRSARILSGRRDAQQHRRRPCATAALLALLLFETSRVSASPERVLRQARHTRRRMGGSELRPFETPTDDSRLSAADITLLINSGALRRSLLPARGRRQRRPP